MNASLLVAPELLKRDQLEVRDADYRHLFRSRRMKMGDALRVLDGEGKMRSAEVLDIARDHAVVALGASLVPPVVSTKLSIWTAVPRPERASWLVEKATELGVREFVFFQTHRSVRGIKAKAVERLERVAKSAILQCGGAWMPRFRTVDDFPGAVEELRALGESVPRFVLVPGAQRSLHQELGEMGTIPSEVALVIGPEGDFIVQEVDDLVTAGARVVVLGNQVLRMETAAVVAAGLVLAR